MDLNSHFLIAVCLHLDIFTNKCQEMCTQKQGGGGLDTCLGVRRLYRQSKIYPETNNRKVIVTYYEP